MGRWLNLNHLRALWSRNKRMCWSRKWAKKQSVPLQELRVYTDSVNQLWSVMPRCVVAQLCTTLLWPHGLPGSSVHGILQARRLEQVAMPSSRGSSKPRDRTHISCISCIGRWFFSTEPTVLLCESFPWHRSTYWVSLRVKPSSGPQRWSSELNRLRPCSTGLML